MKSQLKKIVSLFACVCIALSVMAVAPLAAETQVVFDFGANGTATHNDGSDIGKTKTWTEGDYTLTLTDASKVFGGARDAKGNSALKLGTSSVVGSFKMTVPDDVTSVTFNVAKYKAKTTKISVNGTAHTISTSSDSGAYTAITADTTEVKEITFTTVSGGVRCMIDSIVYTISGSEGGEGGEGGEDVGGEVVPPVEPVVPEVKTIAEVLAMEDSDVQFYLTAEIVDTYRNTWATYGNFILKDDSTEDTIILYGLNDQSGARYDAMATKPVVGDTIKVLANRSSYNGVGQLANAILVEHTPGEPSGGGEGGEVVVPSTPAEIVDAAYALTGSNKLTGVSLTGKVTEIVEEFSSQYGNITIKFVVEGKEDKPISCKRMVVEDATTVEVGDTITVEGDIENNVYNSVSTIQFYKPTLKEVVKGVKPLPPVENPSLALGDVTANSITVDWNAVEGVNSYFVQVTEKATGAIVKIVHVTDANEATIYGLAAETQYAISICSHIPGRPVAYTAPIDATTAAEPVFANPTPVIGAATATTIDVSWDAVDGANGYFVQVTDKATGAVVRVAHVVDATSTTIYGLTAETQYAIAICAHKVGVPATYSAAVDAATTAEAALALSVTVEGKEATFTWTKPANAVAYYLYVLKNEQIVKVAGVTDADATSFVVWVPDADGCTYGIIAATQAGASIAYSPMQFAD